MRTFLRRVRKWLIQDIVAAIKRSDAQRDKKDAQRHKEATQRHKEIVTKIVPAINRLTLAVAFQGLPEGVLRFAYMGREIRLFIPDGAYDHVQSQILARRTFYDDATLQFVRDRFNLSDETVVDVGANIGNHLIFFAMICRAGRCIAFEPNPYAASILQRNVALNELSNVDVHCAALSDVAGEVSFSLHRPTSLGATSFVAGGPDRIPALRLDDVGLNSLGFIKMDVEGGAAKVLTGATETLSAHKPPMLIEINQSEREACGLILERLGYRHVHEFNPRNHLYEIS